MSLQTLTLEYRVPGALDGETLSSAFPAGSSVPDPEQIFEFAPSALGLIDLTGEGVLSPPGNRYVHWFYLVNYTAALNDVVASVARLSNPSDESSPIVDVKSLELQAVDGANVLYSRKCFFIPQGYLLRLRTSGRASLAEDTFVRVGVYSPTTQLEEILIRRAKCCTLNIPTNEFPLDGLPCDPPTVDSFEPTVVILNTPGETFDIDLTGSGFRLGDTSRIVRIDPADSLTLESSSVTFNSAESIQATFDSTGFAEDPAGRYRIDVVREDDPTCFGSIEALEIRVGFACPNIVSLTPGIFTQGTGVQPSTLTLDIAALPIDSIEVRDAGDNLVTSQITGQAGNDHSITVDTDTVVTPGAGVLTLFRPGCDPVTTSIVFQAAP